LRSTKDSMLEILPAERRPPSAAPSQPPGATVERREVIRGKARKVRLILGRVNPRDRALLVQIEEDLLDDTVPTSSILRKAMILGGRAGSTVLRDWARRELNGYGEGDELPEYRKLHCLIHVDLQNARFLVSRQSIGPEDLPDVVQETGRYGDEMEMRQSLDELEKIAANAPKKGIDFVRADSSRVMKLMNHEWRESGEMFARVHALYWTVSQSAVEGIVGRVRTALTEMVSELLAVLPDEASPPTKEMLDGATQFVIKGNRGPIHIANSAASSGATSVATTDATAPPPAVPEAPRRTFWQRFRDRGVIVGGAQVIGAAAGIGGAYAALAAGLTWWPF